MAIAELYSGTQAVDTTEWSCTTDTAGPDADTTDGVFQLFLEISDMVAGDVLEIRLYEKCRTADTQRQAAVFILAGAQTDGMWVSDSFILMHGWDFTLKATSGTITLNWSIRQVS